jgi:tetrahydromethanopterin S-methyltransferase subunit C
MLAAELFWMRRKLRNGLAAAIVTLVAVAIVGVVVVVLPAKEVINYL